MLLTLETKSPRKYLSADLEISNWNSVKSYFEELNTRSLNSVGDLRKWLEDKSELECVISENSGWRYINHHKISENEEFQKSYNDFITEIDPNIQPFSNLLDIKLLDCVFRKDLHSEADIILLKSVENHHRTFRAENIPLLTQLMQEQVKYGNLTGGLTVNIDGVEMTMQKASNFLFNTDRVIREQVYRKLQLKRSEISGELNSLFNTLIKLRSEVAHNAGFDNYRDYMFVEMCRFDYSAKDCFDFHQAVSEAVVPLLNELSLERKTSLGVDTLRPWDLSVDKLNRSALKPYETSQELTLKTIACFNQLDVSIGGCIATMEKMGHLDLDSRKGKAPGGYNYPLYETGVPFIFMNSVGTVRDLVTMVHEGGHALHSILTKDLDLISYKNFPSEVAELASMSMELISMEHWDIFFENEDDLKRAKRDHLEQIIETLPWVATIDKFQHWIYENPAHSDKERTDKWNEIHSQFSSKQIDWSGLEAFKSNIWQKQLHLFEVPFYYIEYGMAQLGAIAVWKNYKENKNVGLNKYLEALKLGYTRSISDIYTTAGIKFDFSKEYISDLMKFVRAELKQY